MSETVEVQSDNKQMTTFRIFVVLAELSLIISIIIWIIYVVVDGNKYLISASIFSGLTIILLIIGYLFKKPDERLDWNIILSDLGQIIGNLGAMS